MSEIFAKKQALFLADGSDDCELSGFGIAGILEVGQMSGHGRAVRTEIEGAPVASPVR